MLDMFELFSGVRMMPSWIVPGGLRGDMPEGLDVKINSFLERFPKELEVVEGLLVENPIWKERTYDVGVMSAKQTLELGCSGPIARGSGVAWDLRKSNPYSSYEDFDFQVPVGERGDVYDRFLVRIAEMKESCKILRQAMDGLPEEQRLTLELAYFMGHSCEEIATITGCAVGTVKARMFHAREKLRIALPSLGGGSMRSSP